MIVLPPAAMPSIFLSSVMRPDPNVLWGLLQAFLRLGIDELKTPDGHMWNYLGSYPCGKVVGIYSGLGIGDIVSVNGSPAKGTAYELFSAAFVILNHAYALAKSNQGAPGVDGQSF